MLSPTPIPIPTPIQVEYSNERRFAHHESNRRQTLHNLIIVTIALTSICLIPATAFASTTANAPPKLLRNPKPASPMNRIRRLYGKHNAGVRRELHRIENNSTDYWRTGFRGDPSFQIPYHNHPFALMEEARTRRRRHLSLHSPHLTPAQIDIEINRNLPEDVPAESIVYRPLRITLFTDALELQRSDVTSGHKVDFIKNQILSRMATFWSSALSVIPVTGPILMQKNELASRAYCGDSEFTEIPEFHFTDGVPDTDLILYISGTPSTRFCGPSTLAVAVACNFDQFDRPIAGAINFCLDQVTIDGTGNADPATVDDNVDVAVHEAAHVLGMSSNSFRYFWDPETGQPRTPRGFVSRKVVCVDDVERNMVVPDENTMVFGTANNGQRYASIVTQTVRTVARNQFDCQTLEGGMLENQPTGTGSCSGDHWDERTYYPEALSGVISSSTNILSPITLALLEDSGWYKANFTRSQVSPWGHGVGCDFVNEPCLVTQGSDVVVPDYGRGYFCTRASGRGCSSSHNYKMGCTVIDYSLFYESNTPDARFQYFPNEPGLGGPRQADYCPLYGSTYKNSIQEHDCRVEDNQYSLGLYSEKYGPDSTCVETKSGEGRCYEAQCIKDRHVVLLRVRGEYHTCTSDFQEITVQVSSTGLLPITIICPRLSSVCPDMFCPANCAGRGVCNFQAVVNGTVRPTCNCFNASDTSPGCAETLTLDGRYLDDSSGLVSKLDGTIFDPLISVFVEEPNTWSNASWAWASGLFALFLLIIICICSSCMPTKNRDRKNRKRVPRSDELGYY